eukprot:5713668-Pyramimonas_sp.AAC.1
MEENQPTVVMYMRVSRMFRPLCLLPPPASLFRPPSSLPLPSSLVALPLLRPPRPLHPSSLEQGAGDGIAN